MRCLLPYDQEAHPTEQVQASPLSILNVYMSAPGKEGLGGDSFFSGSIATAFRNVYQGMVGVQSKPDGLAFTPCLPSAWDNVSARIVYAGQTLEIEIVRRDGDYDIRVNGATIDNNFYEYKESVK